MGVCNGLRQHVALPGFLLLRVHPKDIPCVWFSLVKADDPNLVIREEYVEFTSLNNERIRVIWKAAT